MYIRKDNETKHLGIYINNYLHNKDIRVYKILAQKNSCRTEIRFQHTGVFITQNKNKQQQQIFSVLLDQLNETNVQYS